MQEDEVQELVEALNGFRKSVQQFQTAVNQLDAGLAAAILSGDNFASRMEKIYEHH